MPRTDEGRYRLLVDQALFEADPLILLLNRRAGADLPIAFADAHRHMSHFPSTFLTSFETTAEMLECLNEEALDVMRLKAQCFSPFHLKPQFLDLGFGHGIVSQSPASKQLKQVRLVDRAIDLLQKASLHLVLLAILNRLEQKVLECGALEQFAKHVIDAPTQGLARSLQLFEEAGIDFALARVGRD